MSTSIRSLNGTTPTKGEFVTTQHMVRSRSVNGSVECLDRFMAILKRENFTGTVTVGMTQGSVRNMSAEDRSKIDC